MNQEGSGHKKLIILLVLLLLLLVGAGLFISWWNPSQTKPDTEAPTGFSPFDRPIDRTVDVRGPDIPWTDTVIPQKVVDQPVVQQTQPVIYTEPTSYQPAISRDSTSFTIPTSQQIPQTYTPKTYVQPSSGGIYYNASPTYIPPSYATATPYIAENNDQEPKKENFLWTALEIAGFFAGNPADYNKITQRLVTGNYERSSNPFGGFGGGGGGFGGFGGGGGGAVLEFGGRVNRVTECTCSNSVMLDIADVRGQTLSLLFQNGVSKLYSNFNVHGTGQNVLGNYTSGGACMVYHGEECDSEGNAQGVITQIGTSVQ
jgi:hypothetical protein